MLNHKNRCNVNQGIDRLACTGCGTCSVVCPTKCLTMAFDDEGFMSPVVDFDRCTNCGICVSHCSVGSNALNTKSIANGYIAAIKRRVKSNKSSSGSLFYLLAAQVLKMGGVVFGCYLNQDGAAVHGYVEKLSDLQKFQGSKYVQSNCYLQFPVCKEFLDNGRSVLFSGTPCQIAGIRSYLKKSYDNLITVDLVCHGVPSPLFWEQHVKRLQSSGEITNPSGLSFRSTDRYQRCWYRLGQADTRNAGFGTTSASNANMRIIAPWEKDVYYYAFMAFYSLRESCYRCKFANRNRVSDITLGDCVSCTDYQDFHPTEPVSCVFPITSRGKELFDQIQNEIDFRELNCGKEISVNKQLYRPSKRPSQRDDFYKDYFALSSDLFEKKYLPKLTYKYYIKEIAKRIISVRSRQKLKRILGRI